MKSYPKNLAPTGPNSKTRLANASPSIRGGGCGVRSGLTYRQVMRVGLAAHLGGTITLTPECRQPRIAPPRASTKKETRKLQNYIMFYIICRKNGVIVHYYTIGNSMCPAI